MNLSGSKIFFNLIKILQKIEESDKRYFLKVHIQHPKKLQELHNVLLFLPERMKLEEVEKLVTNLHNKAEDIIRIKNLKQASNHGLVF